MHKHIQRLGKTQRFSEAVVANGFVFLAGMVPAIEDGDIGAQTADVLRQIDAWLATCGTDKSHIVEATIFLSDMADYAGMNSVWDNWVDGDNPPARACVQAKLAKAQWKVEIKVSAVQCQ